MTERYSTPEQGSLDWHNPLNENFNKLDRHVEIRDVRSKRDNYDSADGRKFLATDTGDVFLGDGSEWNQIGTVAPAENTTTTSGGEVSDGSIVAADGEVQQVMNDYATGDNWGPQPMQTVKLASGATYRPTDTWTVPSGIKLDCNGAVVRPDGDFDVLELERSTEVHEPRINVSDNTFTSTCITITAENTGKAGTPNPAHVYNCHLFNNDREGVGLQFRGGDRPCSMQRATGKIHNFDRGLEFRAAGGDTSGQGDWSNGNRFEGNINGSRIPIYLVSEGGAAVGGNTVRAQIQASDETEWVIRQEDAPEGTRIRGNTFIVFPWDTFLLSNEFESSSNRNPARSPIWYIGTGQQEYNSLWDTSGSFSNEFIVNRSTTGAQRNGVLTGTGEAASRGAVDFSHPPLYQDAGSSFHPDS